ncbi:DUF2235 domain-containing protein [Lysobacter arenosi]|uniref:DUF2235 domain-containing protein n=1 Tax=Lysobacter arenosi TaxID=2795387 RepID=A0ABX7R7F6_9GAMM|nr:DUF2235 domain-containing protein [Lysobacter arenosi]QSX74004.1 DUF2235 domain-containing protein [Lysobacter arenosi]
MKRIVICADGTWNIRDQVDKESGKRRPTNVTKLARAVLPGTVAGIDQIVIYDDGVGTGEGLDKYTGGAFGHGIESNVRELYRSILYNYSPSDEIYLFGFSRGAFTVRTLAGFMWMIGLVEKDDDYFVPELYACYERQQGPGTTQWEHANRRVRGTRPCPPIRMIGVWDTVGALGAPGVLGQLFNKRKYRYHDIGLNPSIQHAYQALAVDEQRKAFAPSVWTRPTGWTGVLQQSWFPGVHCNVGGGYSPDGLANGALHWIVDRATALGLEFDTNYLAFYQARCDSYLADSMNPLYRAMGRMLRPTCVIDPSESIHESVMCRRRANADYRPANVP